MAEEKRGTFGKLLQRAAALLDAAAGEKDRSYWTRPIIDELAESALVLDDKAQKEDRSQEEKDRWDFLIARVLSELAFWRGAFKVSWICAQEALERLPAAATPEERRFAIRRSVEAASHYARFEAMSESERDPAFRYAEALIAQTLPETGVSSAERASWFATAARHWFLADLHELSAAALALAKAADAAAVPGLVRPIDAPDFWREMHFDGIWASLLAQEKKEASSLSRRTDGDSA